MKKIRKAVIALAGIFYAGSVLAVLYIWQNEKGVFQISDNLSQIPKEFQALISSPPEQKKEANGVGYFRDERGNFHFYKVQPSVISKPKLGPSGPPKPTTDYNPLLDNSWKGKPNPEVWTKRVQKVIKPDEMLLEGGEVLTFSGITFPEELSPGSAIYQEVVSYEKKLLEGKTIKILFDQKRFDEKNRLLGLVFLGKDIFVNADLVLKGYAQTKILPPNLEYLSLYKRLEDYARKNKLGIWKELVK